MSEDSGWHLQKSFSLGHLVTTIVVLISLIMWTVNLQNATKKNALAIEGLTGIVAGHVAGGHIEAQISLGRLEIIVTQLADDGREMKALLSEILRRSHNRPEQ